MQSVCVNKIEELSMMADGMLSMDKAKELEKHLLVCSACDSYYKDILAMKKSLRTLPLDMQDNLKEVIVDAVRKHSKKKKLPVYFYRYATLAAACLVLAVFFIFRGAFDFRSDKALETAEFDNINSSKVMEERNSGMFLSSDYGSQSESDAGVSAPEANMPAAPESKSEEIAFGVLADYNYTTSAVSSADSLVVNPSGIPLDSGYGGMQDVFYASEAYTLDEMRVVLENEFIITKIKDENDTIFFTANYNMLPKLETRLGLVSAGIIDDKNDSLSVRIISVKTNSQ